MDKFFRISERGSTVKTEIVGGLTTFFAMAYIIFVNSGMLSQTGMDAISVAVATCVSAAIGTFLTAILANVPFAQAPGMGLNAFFTFTVCFGMGFTWQEALAIVFISGVLFLLITISPLRSKVIEAIPAPLKNAIGAGIGLFIALVGLLNSGVISANNNLLSLNKITSGAPLLVIIGLVITIILMVMRVKGALFIGILCSGVIGLIPGFGVFETAGEVYNLANITLAPTLFKMDFHGLFSHGALPFITAVISFTLVDMFDTVGTLLGTASNNHMLDEKGNMPGGDRALIADAAATVIGSCLGTSTVTTYVESSAGISEGARTGLSSIVVSVMFLLSIFITPIFGTLALNGWYLYAITAPALIIVGVLMLKAAAKIEWDNFEIAAPCFLTIAMMPFAYSISEGISFGFIAYTLIKVVRGKFKEVSPLMYVLCVIFIINYILKFMG